MARRSDHTREELKEMILDIAYKIIEQEGFSKLTARRIAKEVGYTPGTIYNLFDSMADLYIEINSITVDKLYTVLSSDECRYPENTPVQNMKKMAELYKKFAKENRPHWLMIFTYIFPEKKPLPAGYQEKITQLFEPLEELLKPYYTDQQSCKRKMAARTLWASVHGICFLEETGKISLINNEESVSDMTGYLIDNFIYGIEGQR